MKEQLFPFYTAPKQEKVLIGNEDIGILEITKLKDITLLEKIFVEQELEDIESSTTLLGEIVSRVIKEEQVSSEVATDIVLGGEDRDKKLEKDLGRSPREIREKYRKELAEVDVKLTKYINKRAIACATALVLYRLIPQTDFNGDAIKSAREFTGSLSSSLIQELVEFWNNEQIHWIEPEGKPEQSKGESK